MNTQCELSITREPMPIYRVITQHKGNVLKALT
jgi:hypothetical protein